ncbi:MAG: beta-hydroxyacyl-ACP dehydratase [Microthrixaceae bacterium]|nr:beta-hydroxyacyl-ACP dehydratase [Microthrixaceae bacterium]
MIDLLPHRPPFRFLDTVERCEPGRHAVTRWRIEGDEAWLAGHFPGRPVVPGVLQVEALAQTGALAVLADPAHVGRLPLLAGLEDVRFPSMVEPGDELLLEVTLERMGPRGGWGHGTASRAGVTTCRARMFFVFAPVAGDRIRA